LAEKDLKWRQFMNNFESFFRYIIPGLIFFIEFILLMIISSDLCINQLKDILKDLSIIITAFVASGGIGFLLGIFYYTLIWRRNCLLIDFKNIIIEAENKGWLEIKPFKHIININNNLSYYWITFSLWDSLKEKPEIKEANDHAVRIAHIANGLGTICIATLISIVCFSFTHFCYLNKDFYSWIPWFILGLLVLLIQIINFIYVVKDHHLLIGSVLLNYLNKYRIDNGDKPMIYYYFKGK
jgi:hypothetical protein